MWLASSAADWLDIVKQGGPIAAMLGVILYGGFKKEPWWVFGWVYKELQVRHEYLRNEKDEWKEIALAGSHVATELARRRKKNHAD